MRLRTSGTVHRKKSASCSHFHAYWAGFKQNLWMANAAESDVDAKHWVVSWCNGMDDSTFAECSVCESGHYEVSPCVHTQAEGFAVSSSHDTVCAACTPIRHCEEDHVFCDKATDRSCKIAEPPPRWLCRTRAPLFHQQTAAK